MQRKRNPVGIRIRHRGSCPARNGGNCRCTPAYEAWVFSQRDERKIRKTFRTLAEAKNWRHDAIVHLRKGTLRAPTSTTLREAAEGWLDGAHAGSIRNRKGELYKPSALRSYEQALTARLLPAFGAAKLSEITRGDLQDLVERLLAEGLDPSTIRNTLMPLRAIYRRALIRGDVAVNPTTGLELPAVRGRRDRIASPDEAAKLIEALAKRDQALWATAFYAGLRRGELMALDWKHVDLANGVIRIERSWDEQAGLVEPKSQAGRRTVPIPTVLRDYLTEHKMLTGGEGFVFGSNASRPFTPSNVRRRAEKAWERAGLRAIGLHEARHTYASLMIAAGVNAKALSTYMGHAGVAITLDRYGHLMPGNEDEAAALLDGYLARSLRAGGSVEGGMTATARVQ